jgi:hypothetical protein
MEANELRIGNYIYRLGVKSIVKSVTKGSENVDYVQLINSDVLTTNQVDPIPLTTEWLLNFGFEHRKCGICGQDQWAGFDFYIKDWLTFRGNLEKDNRLILAPYFDCQIFYVHELQNLYFALTSEKLQTDS